MMIMILMIINTEFSSQLLTSASRRSLRLRGCTLSQTDSELELELRGARNFSYLNAIFPLLPYSLSSPGGKT